MELSRALNMEKALRQQAVLVAAEQLDKHGHAMAAARCRCGVCG